MGVRGLQYYIENKCPDACKSVAIRDLAEEHRSKFNCQPTIVVDGMSLINRLYAKSLEWIYGGQWLQFVNKLEEFVNIFHSIGVKLVFFFDGTVCAEKRKEWVKRRVTKYHQIITIFSIINTDSKVPDEKLFQLPTAMGTLTRFALKEMGVEVYQTDREADEVIVEYANNNQEVFAILSQDSDFIIYNTKTYLSLLHLNLQTLVTIHYDRNYFAHYYLHLNVSQLPLFACLIGNDIIPIQNLIPFQRFLSNNKPGRIFISDFAENLAAVIRNEQWTGNLNNQWELDCISKKICGNFRLSNLIYSGLMSYSTRFDGRSPKACVALQNDLEREMLDRHIKCVNAPFVFNLLCNLEYESSEVLEDNTRLPSALVYRNIRQKCYGVLFNCTSSINYSVTKDGRPILIKEWCAYYGNNMEKPELIQPLPLTHRAELRRMPLSIERIWFHFSEREKFMVFHSIMDITVDLDALLSLPRHHLVMTSLLNYLINGLNMEPLLKPVDVAVFIIQALLMKSLKNLDNITVPWVDSYAVNLSTIFMRGVTTILMVLNICGNPFPITSAMPWHYFDGKFFHYIMIQAKEKANIHSICHQNTEIIKNFFWLLQITTRNTPYQINKFQWRDIFEDFDAIYSY